MSRMGREFRLVLLGSGILTAGYFLAPDPAEAIAAKADEQAADRVHGNSTHRSHYHGGFYPLLFAHSLGYSGNASGRPMSTTAGVTRSGFGGIGRSASTGG